MNVKVLPIAREDVNRALVYIAADDPAAASELYDGIIAALHRAAEFPHAAPQIAVGGRRNRVYFKLYVKPYHIYYRVIQDTLIVMRVLHERMDADSRL